MLGKGFIRLLSAALLLAPRGHANEPTETHVAQPTAGALSDTRPEGAIVRATPGFGMIWDGSNNPCPVAGRMFAGGFSAAGVVSPGLLVGGAALIRFNNPPDAAGCPSAGDDGGRFVLVTTLGPALEWYPSASSGFHLVSMLGYAGINQERDRGDEVTKSSAHGLGAAAGVGYDWIVWRRSEQASLRIGLELQLAALKTFGDDGGHAALSPALLSTFSFD